METAWEMKRAAEIMKGIQTGGMFGSAATVLIAGSWHGRNPELVTFDTLIVGFIVAALVGSLGLAFMGERKRAWQGVVLTIALVFLAAA